MILYHLDRANSFPHDPAKQLVKPINTANTPDANALFNSVYTNGLSYNGIRYTSPFDVNLSTHEDAKATYENSRVFTIEYVFEMVRLLHFSHLPSRFTSLFACQNPKDVKRWYGTLCKNHMNPSTATVKIIETSNAVFIGDSFWRDDTFYLKPENTPVFSPFAYQEWAKKYWNGVHSASPKLEVLCELPVTVLDSIPYSHFLEMP